MWDVLHHSARCVVYISNNNKPGCIVEGYYSSTIPTSKQLCCDTFLVIVFISYLSPPPPVISTRWLLYNLVKKGRASADVILYVASAKLSRFKFLNFHYNLSIELNHDISISICHMNVWTSTQKDQNRTCLPTIGNSLYVVQAMAGRVFLLLILEVPTSLKYGQEIKVFFMFGTFRSKRTRE